MDGLSFEQELRLKCFELTLDAKKAQEAYEFILGKPADKTPVKPLSEAEAAQVLLEDQCLSIRALNICHAADINTLKDLASTDRYEIIGFRNLGRKTFNELCMLLEKHGLDWGMWKDTSDTLEPNKSWTSSSSLQ